jgi:cytosine/adenosine deaminase-related metal-dependent hydrolase
MIGRGAQREIVPASIELEGPRIVSVDRMDPAIYERSRSVHPGSEGHGVLDLGDHLITPAFVNPHTHLALSFMRCLHVGDARHDNLVEDLFFRYEERLTADDVRAFSRMGAYESLLHGVGLVWDHYYFGKAVAAALSDTGLSGVVAPTLQDLAGPFAAQHEQALDDTAQLDADESLRERGIYAAVGPHATDTVSAGLMGRAVALACERNLPVHLHVAQSLDELTRVRAREGTTPLKMLERVNLLRDAPSAVLAHALFADDSDLALLDPERHLLVACPFAQLQFGFISPIREWAERNLAWSVATDCAASNDSMNLQKELRLVAALPHASVTVSDDYRRFFETGEYAAAKRAWQGRAHAELAFRSQRTPQDLLTRVWELPGSYHPGLRAGAIEAGALGNLIAWDTDAPAFWPESDLPRALSFGDTTSAIHALFVAGRPIGRPGALRESVLGSDAYREARMEATERLSRLLNAR